MKIILKKVIVITLLVLIPISLFNYTADPANIFHENYVESITNIILDRKNAALTTANFDERLLQEKIITSKKNNYEIVCLGSSRSLQIDSSLFQDKSFFNHSVSGSSIEDFVAIYEILIENNKLPKSIILGIDPWIFNKNNGQERWL